VTGGRRKLHNEELRHLYSSPSIIRIIKSRRMRWAGHVAPRLKIEAGSVPKACGFYLLRIRTIGKVHEPSN
jgi:hypothetical protein